MCFWGGGERGVTRKGDEMCSVETAAGVCAQRQHSSMWQQGCIKDDVAALHVRLQNGLRQRCMCLIRAARALFARYPMPFRGTPTLLKASWGQQTHTRRHTHAITSFCRRHLLRLLTCAVLCCVVLPVCPPGKALQQLVVRPETALIRPYVVAAVLRGVTLDATRYNSFIDLQVKGGPGGGQPLEPLALRGEEF